MDFLPMPHSVRKGEGFFVLRYDTRIVLENTEPSAFLYAQMLQADVQRFTGLKPAILRGTAQPGDVILRADAALEETSYRLSVTTESVLIRGGSDESLLNGVMTLSQWIQRHGAVCPRWKSRISPTCATGAIIWTAPGAGCPRWRPSSATPTCCAATRSTNGSCTSSIPISSAT